jgi:uncharacterized DUF497 family protein
VYSSIGRFSWSREKSEANLCDRGFDFEFATLIFSGPTLERDDTRRDYGEQRVVAVGMADGIHLTVVYTDRGIEQRGSDRRIISARRASRKERIAYESAVKDQEPQPWPREPRSRETHE